MCADGASFDFLISSLRREFEYPNNSNFYVNAQNLIEILLVIDYQKTIGEMFALIEIYKRDTFRIQPILPYISSDKSEKTEEYIKDKMKTGDVYIQTMILSSMVSKGSLKEDLIYYILSKGNDTSIQFLIQQYYHGYIAIDDNKIMESLKNREEFSNELLLRCFL